MLNVSLMDPIVARQPLHNNNNIESLCGWDVHVDITDCARGYCVETDYSFQLSLNKIHSENSPTAQWRYALITPQLGLFICFWPIYAE